MPEQLAEALDVLVQQAGDRLGRAVAAGETGAAGDQDHLHVILGDPLRHLGADAVQIVLQQHPGSQPVPGLGEPIDEQLAGRIGFQGAGIADGENGDIQRHESRLGLVAHGVIRL